MRLTIALASIAVLASTSACASNGEESSASAGAAETATPDGRLPSSTDDFDGYADNAAYRLAGGGRNGCYFYEQWENGTIRVRLESVEDGIPALELSTPVHAPVTKITDGHGDKTWFFAGWSLRIVDTYDEIGVQLTTDDGRTAKCESVEHLIR